MQRCAGPAQAADGRARTGGQQHRVMCPPHVDRCMAAARNPTLTAAMSTRLRASAVSHVPFFWLAWCICSARRYSTSWACGGAVVVVVVGNETLPDIAIDVVVVGAMPCGVTRA